MAVVEVRLGGCWRPAVVERWRLHHGSTRWIALVRWGAGAAERDWALYEPDTVRQAPRPTDPAVAESLTGGQLEGIFRGAVGVGPAWFYEIVPAFDETR